MSTGSKVTIGFQQQEIGWCFWCCIDDENDDDDYGADDNFQSLLLFVAKMILNIRCFYIELLISNNNCYVNHVMSVDENELPMILVVCCHIIWYDKITSWYVWYMIK
jgi:hypothetical protein